MTRRDFYKMKIAKFGVVIPALLVWGLNHALLAQNATGLIQSASSDNAEISLAVTFDASAANITTDSRFWLKGGSAELTGTLHSGFGLTAGIDGMHAGNSGGGVPLNFVVATFGPSYTYHMNVAKHPVNLFAHGLLGEANGFSGVYPQPLSPASSANGLATKVGGGIDFRLRPHIAVRILEINWLRTQLPNSTTNVQNDFELGVGIVLHSRSH